MTLRVLHLHSGNLYGGVEALLRTLVQHQRHVVDFHNEFALCFEGRFSAEIKDSRTPVHMLGEIRLRSIFSVMRARRRLADLLSERCYDAAIFHSSWSQLALAPVAKDAGLKIVHWLHQGVEDPLHWMEMLGRRVRPSFVLCTSNSALKRAQRLYTEIPADVIFAPVAAPFPGHAQGIRHATRTEFNVDSDTVVVVQAGRIEGWKGHEIHLQALAKVNSKVDWKFWVIGGPQRPCERTLFAQLQAQVLKLGIGERVQFLGQRNDVQRLLPAADLFCQPSTAAEGFSIGVIEAMSAGLPVVGTALGGTVDQVDSTCGYLVDPGNPDQLASALERLIQDGVHRKRLSDGARERARQLCDPINQVRRIAERLRHL